VITGASSGIGLATVLAAAAKNAKLVFAARSGQTLEELAHSINETDGEAIYVVADVGDRRDVEDAIGRFGRIDIWVNNAGASIYGGIEEVVEADNRRLIDTNFWRVVHGSLVALRYLKARSLTLAVSCQKRSSHVHPLPPSTPSRGSPMPCGSS
jgi:NADP-dependent 3-hydroxy acid dehydrogenase YdfG